MNYFTLFEKLIAYLHVAVLSCILLMRHWHTVFLAFTSRQNVCGMHAHARCFVQCCAARYIIKVLIFWSWQRCILGLCIHSCVYNTVYMCINVCTYMMHPLCSWSRYGRGLRTAIGTIKNLYISLQFLKMWLQYCLITLLTSETLCPQKTKQIGVDLIVHCPCEKTALDRKYVGCIILTHQVTWTTAAEGFPRPPVVSQS
jgi:hypothetical protein